MPRRVPDISKIAGCIGYEPSVHLDEIISRVIDYWTAEQFRKSREVVPVQPRLVYA